MEAAFLRAALPEPVIILHQELRPYSIGHELLLKRHDNGFVCKGIPAQIEDLFLGACICHQDYDSAQAWIRSEKFNRDIHDLVKLCGQFDPQPVMAAFAKYIREGSAFCDYEPIKSRRDHRAPVSRPGAPWEAIVLTFLTGTLGWSRTEALNAPYGLAQWLYCTHLERTGKIQIDSDGSQAMRKRIREEMRKLGMEPLKFQPPVEAT